MKDMLGRDAVITAEQARQLLLDNLSSAAPAVESVPLDDSLDRICAEDIIAQEDLPSFARSTVDGYAVRAEDTYGAKETMPAYLNIAGEVFMGAAADLDVAPMAAAKIPTGGMLPRNANAVVMLEHMQEAGSGMIEVMRSVAVGENLIQAGEDMKRGQMVMPRGHRVRAQDIGACAGIGITSLKVYRMPRVSIISTGDEIVDADCAPGPGQVRDINTHLIAAIVRRSGGSPKRLGIFRDEYETLRGIMESGHAESDLIAISGGTSVGTRDMVAQVISDMGSPGVLFHGIALKPGKPMIGGVVRGVAVLGFPGHPAAVALCAELFLKPLVERLSGAACVSEKIGGPRRVTARLDRNVASQAGREEHLRVALEEREGALWAVPVHGKSGLITTLVRADGTIVIPLHVNGVAEGAEVEVFLF